MLQAQGEGAAGGLAAGRVGQGHGSVGTRRRRHRSCQGIVLPIRCAARPRISSWFACCRERHSRQLCGPCATGLLSDSPVALRVFAQRHGWRSIVAAMGSESQRMRRKAVFFTLAHCTDEDNMLAAELAGVIPSLARFLADDHIDLREHSQAALLQLVQSSSKRLSKAREEGLAVAEVRRCGVPLCVTSSADVRLLPRQTLQRRLAHIRSLPSDEQADYEPEVETASELLALVQA